MLVLEARYDIVWLLSKLDSKLWMLAYSREEGNIECRANRKSFEEDTGELKEDAGEEPRLTASEKKALRREESLLTRRNDTQQKEKGSKNQLAPNVFARSSAF